MKTNMIKIATIFILTIVLAFQGCSSQKTDSITDNENFDRGYKSAVVSGKFSFDFDTDKIYQDTTSGTDGVSSSLGISETNIVKYESKCFKDEKALQTKEFFFEGKTYILNYLSTIDNGCGVLDIYKCAHNTYCFYFDAEGNMRSHFAEELLTSESKEFNIEEVVSEAERIVETYMSVNLDEYTLVYSQNPGHFEYVKFIDGYKLKNDYLSVSYSTNNGAIWDYFCGTEFSVFSNDIEIEYDQEAAEEKLKNLILADKKELNEENTSFSFKHEIVWVNEGVIGFEVEVRAQCNEEMDWESYDYIFTILSDGSLVSGDQPVLD